MGKLAERMVEVRRARVTPTACGAQRRILTRVALQLQHHHHRRDSSIGRPQPFQISLPSLGDHQRAHLLPLQLLHSHVLFARYATFSTSTRQRRGYKSSLHYSLRRRWVR